MQHWFRKGNARRFHRVDMPLRFFIIPSSPLEEREIYATGANYFPAPVQNHLETLKRDTIQSLEKIQDQKELISKIVDEIIEAIEQYGTSLRNVSTGINPKQDPLSWLDTKNRLDGFKNAKLIKESSPKTYQYFKMIEEKHLAFHRTLVDSIDQSDKDNFEVKGHLPVGFKLEETMALFKQERFSKTPLIQAILHLSEFMEAYQDIHRHINDDNYLQHFPQEWPQKTVNISASGIALLMKKMFNDYSKVDVFLYFEDSNKTVKFDGTVVDTREDLESHTKRIAINFEFPNGNDQNFIQQEIQKQEVKECMKYTFF